MTCARVAPALLLHVNILLAVYAGAGLATGARLKWDPSTYVVLREAFPREYRAATALLPAGAAALLLLAHAAPLALRTRLPALRRALLLTYAFVLAVMICCEVALVWWVWTRAASWARSPAATELQHALELREHLLPLLQQLAHWHPLPSKIQALVLEAESDAPRNLQVALSAATLLVLLQALGVLLALLAATRAVSHRRPRSLLLDHGPASTPLSSASGSGSGAGGQKRPPRVVYRNGRLEVCGAATTPHSA